MRILFLDQYSELGGAQLCLLDLLAYFRKNGFEAHVGVPGEGPLIKRLRSAGHQIHPISLPESSLGRKTVADASRFVRSLPILGSEIRRLTRILKPQLLYVNGPRILPAVAHAAVSLPIIFHAHNWVSLLAGRPVISWAVRTTQAQVVAASRFVARQWPEARVAYGGVEGPPPGNNLASRDGKFRIGLIGRIAPQKGQLEFVKAAARLSPVLPNARFIVCGDVLFADDRAKAYGREVTCLAPAGVTFTGWKDNVFEVLSNLDLLVVPSACEGGIPRVILEAFAANVPVLALNSGAIPEAVVEAENGFLLGSGSSYEIVSRVRELAGQTKRLTAAASRGHQLWQERFRVEDFGRRVEELLKRL